MIVRLVATARRHWPFAVILALAGALILTHLGATYLWEDEGDTAVLARSILQHGVPVAWDGVTFSAPDFGHRLTDDFVMISHPWLQYYLAAGSFAIFGESAWAARLPFAIAGVATVGLVYALAWRATRRRSTAVAASTLLVLSVQFLLFARQSRNYAPNALVTCLLVWTFLHARTTKGRLAFAGVGIILFHTHPIGLVAVAALLALAWCAPSFADRRAVITWPAVVVLLYAVPWLIASREGYSPNVNWLADVGELGPRLLQFAAEYAGVTPAVGVLVLALFLAVERRRRRRARPARRRPVEITEAGERRLLVACLVVGVGEALVVAMSQSRPAIWILGLHHAVALIPLTALAAAILIGRVAGSRRWLWTTLMVIFGFTRLAYATPWVSWQAPTADVRATDIVTFHVPPSFTGRVFRTGQLHFLRSLGRRNAGIIANLTDFLQRHARPSDVVITNYSWEALYFHTRLPQGLKVPSFYGIYPVARSKNLPDYVFSPTKVRWIVWRKAWRSSWGQDCERVLAWLRENHVPVTKVASMAETMWENRENVHFHRFADSTYVFPWFEDLPDVEIYRVDWPENGRS